MPKPLTDVQLENATEMAAKVVETFGDNWPLEYDEDFGEVICRYEDEDAPFTNVFIEIFRTGQWVEGQDRSPLAEFLAASIVMVPSLLGEVGRLKAAAKAEEARMGELVDERDRLGDLLDRFAAKVAPVADIGEHSNGNDPWTNALDRITPAAEVDRLRAQVSLMGNHLQRESLDIIDKALAEKAAAEKDGQQ